MVRAKDVSDKIPCASCKSRADGRGEKDWIFSDERDLICVVSAEQHLFAQVDAGVRGEEL
jgi:hypothetical protein